MRGLFSLVGLLAVLATVALIAKHQLTGSGSHQAAAASAASRVGPLDGAAPRIDTPGQGRPLQKQVADDVGQLMQGRASDLERSNTEPTP